MEPKSITVDKFSVLTSMNVRMFFHVGFLMETFVAIWTGVGSGVRMDHQMGGQRR